MQSTEMYFSCSEIYNKTCSRLPCHHHTLAWWGRAHTDYKGLMHLSDWFARVWGKGRRYHLYTATVAAFHFNKGLRWILLGNVCIPYQFLRRKQYRYMLIKIPDSANQPWVCHALPDCTEASGIFIPLQMLHAHNKSILQSGIWIWTGTKGISASGNISIAAIQWKMLILVSTHPPTSWKMCSITSRCTMPKASRFQSLPGFAISVNTTSCGSSKAHEHDLRAVYQQCAVWKICGTVWARQHLNFRCLTVCRISQSKLFSQGI